MTEKDEKSEINDGHTQKQLCINSCDDEHTQKSHTATASGLLLLLIPLIAATCSHNM